MRKCTCTLMISLWCLKLASLTSKVICFFLRFNSLSTTWCKYHQLTKIFSSLSNQHWVCLSQIKRQTKHSKTKHPLLPRSLSYSRTISVGQWQKPSHNSNNSKLCSPRPRTRTKAPTASPPSTWPAAPPTTPSVACLASPATPVSLPSPPSPPLRAARQPQRGWTRSSTSPPTSWSPSEASLGTTWTRRKPTRPRAW